MVEPWAFTRASHEGPAVLSATACNVLPVQVPELQLACLPHVPDGALAAQILTMGGARDVPSTSCLASPR